MEDNAIIAASEETTDVAEVVNATDVVDVVTSNGGYRLVGNAANLLAEIQPVGDRHGFSKTGTPARGSLRSGSATASTESLFTQTVTCGPG